MESYAINLVLPKLQNGTKWNVTSLQLEILIFALILGLLRGMLGRSFLLELPPRARRILNKIFLRGRPLGTTSACAENTQTETGKRLWGEELPPRARRIPTMILSSALTNWNYLRVRGEYCPRSRGSPGRSELPPRARRILFNEDCAYDLLGTTSACAENTPMPPTSQYLHGNYLRVRGEYFLLRLKPTF